MNLTTDEYNILATRHANSYEAAQLRDRLLTEGLHFCSVCKTIREAAAFRKSARGRGGRESRCRRCNRKKRARSGYIPTGLRYAENEARRRERDPDAYREGKREADWKYAAKKRAARLAKPERPKRSPGEIRASQRVAKRRTFRKRKALGMTGRQANHMADASEHDAAWNQIKYN